MLDLTQFAGTRFYCGKPDEASGRLLKFDGHDYNLEVRIADDGSVSAVMNSGRMEWHCALNPDDLIASIDAALEDSCTLGHAANWSNDE